MAVGVERKLGMGEVVAGLIVGEEAFGPARDPSHRASEPPRRPGDNPFLRVELALVAEAAAHVGGDDAQRALGNAELLAHLAADVMGRLGRGIERELVGAGLGCGDEGARLDRRADQAIVDEIDRDRVRGRLQRLAHRGFVAARPTKADIAGCRRMQLRRVPRLRRARIGDGGQRRVIDRDGLGRIRRLGNGFGDDRRHRFAHMPHRLAREREARRLGHGRTVTGTNRPQGPHRRHAVRRHVGAGEHGDHPGRGGRRRYVDGANARMRVRRTHEHAGERAGKLDVRDEAPAADEKAPIFHPAQRRADALIVAPACRRSVHRVTSCPSDISLHCHRPRKRTIQ